jgi:hypothetical protein
MDTIQRLIDAKAIAMNTALPGEVVSYDASTGKAEVRALVRQTYEDGVTLTPPVISNVPIIMPRTRGASLTLPVASGDPVLIVFAQWSIDRWASEGRLVNAGDARTHSMSDAVAFLGAFSFKDGPTGESGTVLKDGNTKVKIDGEKVAIGNTVAELLEEVVAGLNATATSNCVNGAPLTKAAQIAAAAANIEAIRGSL